MSTITYPTSVRRTNAQQIARSFSGFNYIDGELVLPISQASFAITDPANLLGIGRAPESNKEDIDVAVIKAAQSFDHWSAIAPLERSRLLLEAASNIERNAETLASLISLETGRPIATETRPEVVNAVRIFRYFAGLAPEAKGESIPYATNVLAITLREPLGVVAAIVPWNVPAMLFCLKAAPALAMGNTVVVKPAEQSTLASLYLAKVIGDALPRGVLNVVCGHGEGAGQHLTKHLGISKITFTGSVETGKRVYGATIDRLIPVTLELGGKSPIVICPDSNVDKAVKLAITGMRFSRQGQSCTSTTRILVHRDLRERFLQTLEDEVSQMKMGDPLSDETQIGSLISKEQVERVESYVSLATQAGVKSVSLGIKPTLAPWRDGHFSEPRVLLDPPMASEVVQEEIFGPIATLHSWGNLDEVVEMANGTNFGLSACIVTENTSNALTLARKLKAGFVQINSGLVIQPGISFGGYRQSGLGREASLAGMLEAFTQVKSIIIDHS